MTLDQLRPGERAQVGVIHGTGTFRRRLLELGFVPGTTIERTGQAPFGDPLSYRLRGAVVCLRGRDAAAVDVVDVVRAAQVTP